MNCSLLRRIGIIFYDSLILFSIYIFASLIPVMLNSGHAISHGNVYYDLYLLFIAYLYFSWQWLRGGQTLAMRAWHVRLRPLGKNRLDLKTVSLRFLLSVLSWIPFGAGYLWCLFDRDKLAFHDRFSKTRLEFEKC